MLKKIPFMENILSIIGFGKILSTKLSSRWVGFCQYRKFFLTEDIENKDLKFENLKNILQSDYLTNNNDFDCILGKKFSVENYKISKIVKHHLFDFLKNPKLFIDKKKKS